MKNISKVANKIRNCDEKIVVFSDADMDGVASGMIMKGILEELSKEAEFFFADKQRRGYGLSEESVGLFADRDFELLITLDCGISNFKGVKKAKEAGFEVVIIDHHKPHDRLPEADLIVCPKLEEKDYFKEIPNAALTVELAKELDVLKDEFYEYGALAVVGDMMPHEKKNSEIIDKALKNFPRTTGMKAFREVLEIDKPLQLIHESVPALNVTEMISGTPESFIFFGVEKMDQARVLARKLLGKYEARQDEIKQIVERGKKEDGNDPVLFFGGDWSNFLLGKAASKLVKEKDKPVFIYRKGEPVRGTARVPEGEDAVEAMSFSEEVLINYGGHPPAAGFTIKEENLGEFEENLNNYFRK